MLRSPTFDQLRLKFEISPYRISSPKKSSKGFVFNGSKNGVRPFF